MKQIFTFLAAVVLTATTYAQVGIGTTIPAASAALDITSTTQGLLIPRMEEGDRIAIDTPATGLMVYQTDGTAGFYYYNGSSWVAITAGLDGTNVARQDATNIFNGDNSFIGGKKFIVDIPGSSDSQITFAGREVSIQGGLEAYSGPDTHIPVSVSGALNVNQSYFGGVDDRSVNYIKTPKVEITTEPEDISDATTKKYVDDLIIELASGLDFAFSTKAPLSSPAFSGTITLNGLVKLGSTTSDDNGKILVLADGSTGILELVSPLLASGTQAGIVSISDQSFAGEKIFTADVEAKRYVLKAPTALAASSTTTLDLSTGNVLTVTLGTNTTVVTDEAEVGTYLIKLVQDDTGGRTVSFPLEWKWSGGTVPTVTAEADKTDIVTLIYDGSTFYAAISQNF